MKSLDPFLKFNIEQSLFNFIYQPAKTRLDRKLLPIMEANRIRSPEGSMAFLYKGTQYAPEGFRPSRRIGLLHRTLYTAMDEFVQEAKSMEQEKMFVANFLKVLLVTARNWAELNQLTPDCLKSALPKDNSHQPGSLSEEAIASFQHANRNAIQTVKERLVLNMLQ